MHTLDQVLTAMREHHHARNATDDERAQRRITDDFWRGQNERQHALAVTFGELNGWRLSRRMFMPEMIGTRRKSLLYAYYDHPLHYRDAAGLNAAIIGQPYGKWDDTRRARLDATAREYGLRWSVPPQPFASIWYPGSCLFIVLTKPDVEVHWLPEQIAPTGALLQERLRVAMNGGNSTLLRHH
jgi:hypothetical protein